MFTQLPVAPLSPSLDFAGQTVLITGANTGLGYSTALLYLQHGASTVIIGVRTTSKGEAAKAKFLSDKVVSARINAPNIVVWELDMASEKSVVAFANRVKSTYPVLHIAILNAGGFPFKGYGTSKETGRETTVQVNYVSTVLLGILLLPLLKSTSRNIGAPTNLTFTGSEVARGPRIVVPNGQSILNSLNNPKKFSPNVRYGESKLLLAAFVKAFAPYVDSSEVIVNNLCPGAVATDLGRDAPWYLQPLFPIFLALMAARTPDVGARLIVRAGCAGKETHGLLLANHTKFSVPFIEGADGERFIERLRVETLSVLKEVTDLGL
ncbi:NAD(P)-binding protein [Cylindrobasidium torrendii FP15055 ss-10]|uniref:NAD(P)-binding protein n=1 Tax=Cylindrobasidium torrendii FP15055 ss-10 TaxID=1314674 RepID=A0A0D7BQ96_9AGAR|nr:NAD(P)-binding protein [Cylindrobasidium torrendii FP15055 ss-10]